MYDTGKVIVGLVVFLAVVTSPMLYQLAKGGTPEPPELKISPEYKTCIAPTEYMRSLHMDLLNTWRDQAVRDGDRLYVASDGKVYEKSIAATCLGKCHSSRTEFCDRCHEYVGEEPYCWECHAHKTTHTAMRVDETRFTEIANAR
jgi:hypothetical protein